MSVLFLSSSTSCEWEDYRGINIRQLRFDWFILILTYFQIFKDALSFSLTSASAQWFSLGREGLHVTTSQWTLGFLLCILRARDGERTERPSPNSIPWDRVGEGVRSGRGHCSFWGRLGREGVLWDYLELPSLCGSESGPKRHSSLPLQSQCTPCWWWTSSPTGIG